MKRYIKKIETIETVESAKKTTKNVQDSISVYKKLFDRTDLLNNKNLTLSNEDYKEFFNTQYQIADLFPSLIRGMIIIVTLF